jgi:mannose-6-phosphate isomerase-like protein (cupin superfamily)
MEPAEEIHNPRTGQRMRFLDGGDEPAEALLRTESINPPTAVPEPEHVHPRQESRARVISGTLRFCVEGREHRLGPGDAITLPAGTPHFFVNDGVVDAVSIQEFRPALRSADLFRTLFSLSERGKVNERGMPSLLALAALGAEFSDEIRATSPPWAMQRAAFALLGPLARMRGGYASS